MAEPLTGAFGDGQDESVLRSDRRSLVCFCGDAETEEALRNGLSEPMRREAEFRRADVARAIGQLRTMPTPWTLVVDVSGHPQPLAALEDLSHVVEPDVRVLVVGEREDVGFYRQITRGLGVADYLYKPLTPAMVAEHFGPVIARRRAAPMAARGGRLLSVTGVRGGVGASTIAANLAWYLAVVARRHTVALDADAHRGTLALLLSGQAGGGLRSALSDPERVDELFVERMAHMVSDRLHLVAGEEPLADALPQRAGAGEKLARMLRRRYNFVVADAPFAPSGFSHELREEAQQVVLVLEPTLACLRDTLRLLQVEQAADRTTRPLIVLNRAGRRGGLPTARVADTLKLEIDVVIPDFPRRLEEAATLGKPAAELGGPFAAGIAQLARAAGGVTLVGPRRGLAGLIGMLRR